MDLGRPQPQDAAQSLGALPARGSRRVHPTTRRCATGSTALPPPPCSPLPSSLSPARRRPPEPRPPVPSVSSSSSVPATTSSAPATSNQSPSVSTSRRPHRTSSLAVERPRCHHPIWLEQRRDRAAADDDAEARRRTEARGPGPAAMACDQAIRVERPVEQRFRRVERNGHCAHTSLSGR